MSGLPRCQRRFFHARRWAIFLYRPGAVVGAMEAGATRRPPPSERPRAAQRPPAPDARGALGAPLGSQLGTHGAVSLGAPCGDPLSA